MLISFIYFVYVFINKYIKDKKTKQAIEIYTQIFGKLIIALLLGISIFLMIEYFKSEEKITNHKHFKNIIIESNLNSQIDEVDNFIKQKEEVGKTVYILDCSAAIYMIPLDRYNKNYDMFNLGNFGGNGNKGIIEDIKQKQDAIFLILQEKYINNWQHPIEITNYVKENYKKVDQVAIFDAYEKTE